MVFKGNSTLEENWDPAVTPWSSFGINGTCESCTANAFAVQGYNEAKEATNNWELTQNRYAGAVRPLYNKSDLLTRSRGWFSPLRAMVWADRTRYWRL
jgi:hypothetical protein